jgi:LEA14-like dessication related protein
MFKIEKMDFSGVDLGCTLNVENPNDFPLPFPELDLNYSVNAVPFLKSNVTGMGPVAAKAVAPVDLKFRVDYVDLLKTVTSLISANSASFNLDLGADFPVPALEGIKTALQGEGSFPILKKPDVSFKGITIKSMGLSRMEFQLTWEIDNKNSFAMDIENFAYDFKVNTSQWAKGVIDTPPRVGANKVTAVPLSVTINSLDMVKDLVNIISRGTDVSYNCAGDMKLAPELPGLDKIDLPLNLAGKTKLRNQ